MVVPPPIGITVASGRALPAGRLAAPGARGALSTDCQTPPAHALHHRNPAYRPSITWDHSSGMASHFAAHWACTLGDGWYDR